MAEATLGREQDDDRGDAVKRDQIQSSAEAMIRVGFSWFQGYWQIASEEIVRWWHWRYTCLHRCSQYNQGAQIERMHQCRWSWVRASSGIESIGAVRSEPCRQRREYESYQGWGPFPFPSATITQGISSCPNSRWHSWRCEKRFEASEFSKEVANW